MEKNMSSDIEIRISSLFDAGDILIVSNLFGKEPSCTIGYDTLPLFCLEM
jgi:hypothetical protein